MLSKKQVDELLNEQMGDQNNNRNLVIVMLDILERLYIMEDNQRRIKQLEKDCAYIQRELDQGVRNDRR